jgi:hypothetical protein
MAGKQGSGRVGLFGRKDGGVWISGVLSADAGPFYVMAREELLRLYVGIFGEPPGTISKADVIEYALRGRKRTREYFLERRDSS